MNETLRQSDDFDIYNVNFPFICSNIPAAPAYGVYISQLICYSRACCWYYDFLKRAQLLTHKLIQQGFVACPKLDVITTEVSWLISCVGWPLWNICLQDENRLFPLRQPPFLFHRILLHYQILHDQHGGSLIRNRRCLLYRCTWPRP